MYGYIYCITNLVNGKKYVGQSTGNPRRRGGAHFWKSSRGILLKACEKYGREAFHFEVIGGAADQDLLDLLEQAAISLLHTVSPQGYNLRRGGQGGGRFSYKTIRKFIELRNTPEYRLAASKLQREVQARPEVKAAQRQGVGLTYLRPGYKEKKVKALKEALVRPEVREKLLAARRRLLADPEFRRRQAQGVRAAGARIGAAHRMLRWITNGSCSKKIPKDMNPPAGWTYGRSPFHNKRVNF